MPQAVEALSRAETSAKSAYKVAKASAPYGRFPPGIEWDIVHADAVVLLGLTQALSESYMGYVKCL